MSIRPPAWVQFALGAGLTVLILGLILSQSRQASAEGTASGPRITCAQGYEHPPREPGKCTPVSKPPPPVEKPPPPPQCEQGDEITAHSLTTGGGTATGQLTVAAGCHVQVSLASYRKPSTQFPQQLFDSATQTFGPGQHTLSIRLPDCIWQVDFARGGVIGPVLDHHGMYGARLLNGRQGGEGACNFAPPPPVEQPPVQQPPVQQPPVQQPPVQQPPVQQETPPSVETKPTPHSENQQSVPAPPETGEEGKPFCALDHVYQRGQNCIQFGGLA